MMEHWKELLVGIGLAVAGAAGGVFASQASQEARIERIESDVSYLRDRVDIIIDRLPPREVR